MAHRLCCQTLGQRFLLSFCPSFVSFTQVRTARARTSEAPVTPHAVHPSLFSSVEVPFALLPPPPSLVLPSSSCLARLPCWLSTRSPRSKRWSVRWASGLVAALMSCLRAPLRPEAPHLHTGTDYLESHGKWEATVESTISQLLMFPWFLLYVLVPRPILTVEGLATQTAMSTDYPAGRQIVFEFSFCRPE